MHRVSGASRATGALFTAAEARDIVGGLSKPSKMPGLAYGLPAKECKTGSVLAKIPNSVCANCYALKGRYRFDNVQNAQYRRLATLTDPRWVAAMAFLIQHEEVEYFRWHDSGDIQDLDHLQAIVEVARLCPDTKFWLPTRERSMVHDFMRLYGAFPPNLIVRVSGAMIDGVPPIGFQNTSTVVTSGETCPSRQQNNSCGACRACWDPGVMNVSYHKH